MSKVRDSQGSILWGLLIVAVGVIFLLGSLGHLRPGQVFRTYWPVFLIIIGLWQMISSGFRNVFPGVLLVVIGVIFLGGNVFTLPHSLWVYVWPLAIVALGLWLLLGPLFRRPSGSGPAIKADDLNATVVLGGMTRVIGSTSFKGGRGSAVMGGLEIDFQQASLDQGQATLDLTAIMGGIDVKVPQNWRVVLHGTPILGGVEDKTRPVPEARATLHIRANVFMGGIEVKN